MTEGSWLAMFLGQKTVWAAVLLGALLPLFGRHLVLGRTVLLGLALPQVSLAGVAFVFMGAGLGWRWCSAWEADASRAFLGAALFTLPALALVARRERLSEAGLAFLYLGAAAAAHLFVCGNATGEAYTHDLFHGQLLLLDDASFTILAGVLVGCGALALLWRRRIVLALCDPAFAQTAGIRPGRWLAVAALLNGVVISVAVATAGPLVAFAGLVLPVLSAAALAGSLRAHLGLAVGAGAFSALAGCAAAYRWDLPLGDSVVAAGCVLLLCCRAVAKML